MQFSFFAQFLKNCHKFLLDLSIYHILFVAKVKFILKNNTHVHVFVYLKRAHNLAIINTQHFDNIYWQYELQYELQYAIAELN